MGCYHGKFSFDQLSHLRSCLIKQLKMEGMNDMRYPPHTLKKLGWARFFILKTMDLGWMGRMALLALLAVVAAVATQVSYRRRRKEPPLLCVPLSTCTVWSLCLLTKQGRDRTGRPQKTPPYCTTSGQKAKDYLSNQIEVQV